MVLHTYSLVFPVKHLDVCACFCCRWTSMVSEEHKYGHTDLHQLMAAAYWKGKSPSPIKESHHINDEPTWFGLTTERCS